MRINMLIIYTAVFFSFSAFAQTGDELFMQTYSLDEVDIALQSVGICDDFLPYNQGSLGIVNLWMVFLSGNPPTITVAILEDDGSVNPNTANPVFSSPVVPSYTVTGDVISGEDVILVSLDISPAVNVSGSQRYWLELTMPVGGFWLGQKPVVFGSPLWLYSENQYVNSLEHWGTAYDTFFELYQPVSLERNSWGSIKASF